MKQKDILLVALVVFISGIFSFILSNLVVGSPSSQKQEVEVVEPISADFTSPDDQYFNDQSINPTQTIRIGENPNPQPFNP